MIRILIFQFGLPIVCYFIGVAVGEQKGKKKAAAKAKEHTETSLADPEDIQHVGYSLESMGRDK